VLRVFRLGKKVGVDMQAFYIIGFPRETMENIQTTLDFALDSLKKYDVLPHMAIARPDPGTDLFREAKENDHLVVDRARETTEGMHTDTFVRYMVKGEAFTPEIIAEVSEKFHIKSIRTITLKSMGYMLRHPIIAAKSMGYLIGSLVRSRGRFSDSMVKLFFCKLFYQNALLRENMIVQAQKSSVDDFEKLEIETEAAG
jgi:radical SAM superfamily enzyme YgiQ (UPF0313 family)